MKRLALWALCVTATARADSSVPADAELFEGYCPLTDWLYGPLTPSQTRLLPRWLAATTHGNVIEVVIEPERRIRWRLTRAAFGTVEKVVSVDGAMWTTSRFSHNEGRVLVGKDVSGPGAGAGLHFDYTRDGRGRLSTRQGATERLRVTWHSDGTAETELSDGARRRRDEWDAAGNLKASHFGHISLVYNRDSDGRLAGILRRRGKSPLVAASFAAPDGTVNSDDVVALGNLSERWEALLALGQPATHTVDATTHVTRDSFSGKSCWLNKPSGLDFDSADRVVTETTGCICGFCVGAGIPLDGDALVARDEHFTDGPWLRIDGALDITAEHRLMTPRGPVAAGALRPGDVVFGADGRRRAIATVRPLPRQPRLGVNLRTAGGTFRAAGFLLESESGACALP